MSSDDGVLVFFVCWHQFVQEAEELVNLRFGKIGVVGSVFDFESIGMVAFACHDVGQRVKAWVAYWNADCVVVVFLQQLDEYAFAVETAFAPTAKCDFVDFLHGNSSNSALKLLALAVIKDYCIVGFVDDVWVMLPYTLRLIHS